MKPPRPLHLVPALLLALASTPSLATPPTDARIDQAIASFEKVWNSGGPSIDDIKRAAAEATQGLKLDDLTGVQLGRLLAFQLLIDPIATPDQAFARLKTMLPDRGADGATAAVLLLRQRLDEARESDAKVAILRDTYSHPGLERAIAARGVNLVFTRLSMVPADLLRKAAPEVLNLDRLLTPELLPLTVNTYPTYYEMLQTVIPDRPDEIERRRARLVSLARNAVPTLQDPVKEWAAHSADVLDSPATRGTLLNNPAPALTFTWCSDPAIHSLADLKGRIVVLDFWTTACSPCVASFPKTRELVARYKDFPVIIVGITSPQGFVVKPDGGGVDQAKGDPAKEASLLAEYHGKKDMTWPIAMIDGDVFNPAYGVRGIPHITIIDAQGKVRYNGLHPTLTPEHELAADIDALLKEASLPAPPPLPAPNAKPKPGA